MAGTRLLFGLAIAFLCGLEIAAQEARHTIRVGEPAAGTLQVSGFQAQNDAGGIVFGPYAVYRTTFEGDGWTAIPSRLGDEGSIAAVRFVDDAVGWLLYATGDAAEIWRTTDGGQRWERTDGPLPAGASWSMSFTDRNHGWLLARLPSNSNFSYGRLYRTEDGGRSWAELAPPPAAGRIDFATTRTGWITGGASGHELFVTRDGGRVWTPQALPVPNDSASYEVTPPRLSRAGRVVVGVSSWEDDGEGVLRAIEIPLDGGALVVVAATHVHATRGLGTARLVAATRDAFVVSGDVTVRDGKAASAEVFVEPAGLLQSAEAAGGRLWMTLADGTCAADKSACEQRTRLGLYTPSRNEFRDVTPLAEERRHGGAPETDSVEQSTKRGFDKCAADTVSNMQTWWTSSPYYDANIYIGGNNRSCSQTQLTSSWVSQIFNQGWKLIPTWVGPQSPSTTCSSCSRFSSNATTARQQGVTEANAAASAMSSLGLGAPSIVYYDLEMYSTATTAETQFAEGWSERLHQLGYKAGLYVHWTNVASFANLSNPLDGAWIARWYYGANGSPPPPSTAPSPNSIPGVSDSIFVNKRIWQYYGSSTESYGGVSFNIDIDIANGPVASSGGTSAVPDLIVSDLTAPSSGTIGGTVSVSTTVFNQGTGDAAAYRLGFYYSTDANITTSDVYSGSVCNMSALTSGGSQGCSGAVNVPSSLAPGTYYLGAIADDLSAVSESSESNNTAARQIALGQTTYTISVSASPAGGGAVSGGGTFAAGSSRTVTATANSGYTFAQWTENGGFVSSSASYNFTLNANRNLVAVFNTVDYVLTVSGGGTGSGTVTGGGINCTISGGSSSGTCSSFYASGTVVSLTATAASGSTFSTWGGSCAGSGTCSVTMSSSRSVTATFDANVHGFYVIPPCRLVDTRVTGGIVAALTSRNVAAANQCGIPADATALSVNLTAVSPASTGYLTLYPGPAGAPVPATSTLNFTTGRTLANNAVAMTGNDGTVNVYNGAQSAVHFIIDVNGYFR